MNPVTAPRIRANQEIFHFFFSENRKKMFSVLLP